MASLFPEFLLNIAPNATDMLRRLVSPVTPSIQNCISILFGTQKRTIY